MYASLVASFCRGLQHSVTTEKGGDSVGEDKERRGERNVQVNMIMAVLGRTSQLS